MSYISKNLSALGATIGGSSRIWEYWTADSLATVMGAGYISDAANKRLLVGDVIMVCSGTLNTTGPDAAKSVNARGVVSEFASGPSFAILIVDSITTGAATLMPASKQTVIMPLQLADIATGTFKIGMADAFIVTSALFRTAKPASTASKLATLTVGISGVAVTGGVMALTTANQNTIGGTVAASAITALNVGAAGSTLEVTASAVTAFVEGDGWVEFTVASFGRG